ncbi:hypothetical protein [Moorella sp. E306M]|nr:hypothetical protein [Moorella sp. E306M]
MPGQLQTRDFIWLAGKEILDRAVQNARQGSQACGLYCRKE